MEEENSMYGLYGLNVSLDAMEDENAHAFQNDEHTQSGNESENESGSESRSGSVSGSGSRSGSGSGSGRSSDGSRDESGRSSEGSRDESGDEECKSESEREDDRVEDDRAKDDVIEEDEDKYKPVIKEHSKESYKEPQYNNCKKSGSTKSRFSSKNPKAERERVVKRSHKVEEVEEVEEQEEDSEVEVNMHPTSRSRVELVVDLEVKLKRMKQLRDIFNASPYFDLEDVESVTNEVTRTERSIVDLLAPLSEREQHILRMQVTVKHREIIIEKAVANQLLHPGEDGIFSLLVSKQVTLLKLVNRI